MTFTPTSCASGVIPATEPLNSGPRMSATPSAIAISAARAAPSIAIEVEGRDPGRLSLLLDAKMVDVKKKELTVTLNGEQVFRGKPPASLAAILTTLGLRADLELLRTHRVVLN